jgi:predicted TIM-barrel enzyme
MDTAGVIKSLFGVPRALVGVVHTQALPGTPGADRAIDQIVETAKAAEFFLVDGVIVSGIATGQPTDASEVTSVARAVGVPTLVGSGVTLDNVHDYDGADALIVGSSIKQGGVWSGPIDESRTRALAAAFRGK